MKLEVASKSPEQSIEYASQIGSRLRGGEVIELVSDVGGGKTTFVRGLAKGAGSKDHVSSPTFTISKVYTAPKFDIMHFDFYRLSEPGLVEYEISEAVSGGNTVVIIEWSEIVSHVIPQDSLRIEIIATDVSKRRIVIDAPDRFDYLFKQ